MCSNIDPGASTSVGRSNASSLVPLTTTPLTTAASAGLMTCTVICLFTQDDDDLPSPVQVSSVALVDPETGDPIPGFGAFTANREAREAARRLLRSVRLPVPKRRLAVFGFSAPAQDVAGGQKAQLRWEVNLCGAKRRDLKRVLGEFHGWITGASEGGKFEHHVGFHQIEDIRDAA